MNQASHEIVEFKADADGPLGLFAAKVSAIGNVDRNGDRIMPGAWDGTIGRWKLSGKQVPVVWSHDHKNPHAFIGSIDPNDIHVTEDGVTVAGKLDVETNPLAAQAFDLLQRGLVKEWSFAYAVSKEKVGKDLAREIHELDLFEVGPTLIGANPETLTLATKEAGATGTVTVTAPETVAVPVTITYPNGTTSTTTTNLSLVETVEAKQVDNSAWDGNAAMSAADSAADYRAICAGRRDGPADERGSWALPHHKRAGAPPNAAGVRNALARLPQTQGLTNAGAARAHLEAHMASIRSEAAEVDADLVGLSAVNDAVQKLDTELDVLIEQKIGRVISRRTEEKIRAAVAQLSQILAVFDEDPASTTPTASSSPEQAAAEEPPTPGEAELARRRIEQTGLFLAERNR